MSERKQSDVLLARIREGLARRGWNTAALASRVGIERPRLRQVLSGRAPMTVDEFGAIAEAMALTAEEMGLPAGLAAPEEAPGDAPDPTAPEPAPPEDAPTGDAWIPDPDGVQAEQCIRLGYACGIDMLLHARTADLGGSGVPRAVLDRFPQRIPIRLDAAFHAHNRARYLPEGLELRLSFDRVYTCLFPWSSIEQVVFVVERPEAAPEPAGPGRPHLRLVTS